LEEKEIATTAARTRVSSGYGRLDEVLKGGFLAGTAIVLSAPASDEVPLLIGNFLRASFLKGIEAVCLFLPSSVLATLSFAGLALGSRVEGHCFDSFFG
jgi:hypothetical protein